MKSYTYKLFTKREIAEIMTRPLNIDMSDISINNMVERMILKSNDQFLRGARKSIKLNVTQFLNNNFLIKYEIDPIQEPSMKEILETLKFRGYKFNGINEEKIS